MTVHVKLTEPLYSEIFTDLSRPHDFADERIGFVMARMTSLPADDILILSTRYHPVLDHHYIKDPTVGARIGPEAMARAMRAVYDGRPTREGIFHVHIHPFPGITRMSTVDRRELPPLIPGFQSVGPQAAHGLIILSLDHASAWVWLPSATAAVLAPTVTVVGSPIRIFDQQVVLPRRAFPRAPSHKR